MTLGTNDLYRRISELRGEALEILTDMMHGERDLMLGQTGEAVQAMQQVSNRLGFAATVLALTPAQPVAVLARTAAYPVAAAA